MKTPVAAAVVALATWVALRGAARQIRANPDPYPPEILRREVDGDERVIPRPDGTLLRTISAGEGTPVVLAHGYGVTTQEWNLIWDNLIRRGHRVIAFDQRGHGRSTIGTDGIGSAPMADDYAAVLDHYDVHDAVLVGHSMGGFVAIRAVLDHPEVARRLRGLVLLATWAGRITDGAPQNWLQIPMLQLGIMQWLAHTRTGGTLFCAAQMGTTPSPAMVEAFRDLFVEQNHRPLLPIVRAFMAEDRYPRLGEIDVPAVVLVGDADRTTPRGHAQRMASGIPNATLTTVADAGHCLNWEEDGPSKLVEAIGSFPARV